MSEEVKDTEVKDEETKVKDVEVEEQPEDKPVEQSQFNRYRDAYLREQLKELGVDDSELTSSMAFVNDKADGTDSNMDEVMHDLRVRMRLDEKTRGVDPSPMNGAKKPHRKVDKEDIGRKAVARVMGRVRL